MNDDQLDSETVAAFLDGTLPEAERARVERILASSPELLGDTLEAVKIAAELEQESKPRPVSVVRAHRTRWQRRALIATPFLAAASIVGLLIVRRDDPPEVIALARSAQLTTERGPGSIDRSLGTSWDQPGWTTVRGGSIDGQSVGTTMRMGARVAQLEFSASANDSAAYARVASALSELLASIDGAGPVAEQARAASVAWSDAHPELVSRVRALSMSVSAFDLGVWLETARLAGASGRTAFLEDGSSALAALRAIRRAIDAEGVAGQMAAVISHVDALLESGSQAPPDARFARVDSAMSVIPR